MAEAARYPAARNARSLSHYVTHAHLQWRGIERSCARFVHVEAIDCRQQTDELYMSLVDSYVERR